MDRDTNACGPGASRLKEQRHQRRNQKRAGCVFFGFVGVHVCTYNAPAWGVRARTVSKQPRFDRHSRVVEHTGSSWACTSTLPCKQACADASPPPSRLSDLEVAKVGYGGARRSTKAEWRTHRFRFVRRACGEPDASKGN